MADYAETRLTAEHERVYFSFDAADAPTEATTTLPAGMEELGENSDFTIREAGATGDGQAREDRGFAHPMPTNSRSNNITFDLKQRFDRDPSADLGFRTYGIVGLMKVLSNGYFIFAKCLITDIEHGGATNGMPTWSGTAQSQGPTVEGKITVWPPVEV